MSHWIARSPGGTAAVSRPISLATRAAKPGAATGQSAAKAARSPLRGPTGKGGPDRKRQPDLETHAVRDDALRAQLPECLVGGDRVVHARPGVPVHGHRSRPDPED